MKKWTSDNWISLVAIVASIGTLFTVVYQTNLYREQQYASVLPYLEIWNSRNKNSYKLILINNGIGPAFIEEVKILYKDSAYYMDPARFASKVINKEDTLKGFGYSNINKGSLIPSGRSVNLVQVNNDSINSLKLWSWYSGGDTSRVHLPDLEITYKSVYGEKWKIRKYGSNLPERID